MFLEDWSTVAIESATADDVIGTVIRSVLDCVQTGRLIVDIRNCCERPDFWRVEFRAPIDRSLIDKFANDRSGYRGHFFNSPAEGERFNARVVDGLTEILVSAAMVNPLLLHLSPPALTQSIRAAKIWPVEKVDFNSCSCKQWHFDNWNLNKERFWRLLLCEPGRTELENAEWMRNEFDDNIRDVGPFRFATDALEIKGAFVTEPEMELFTPQSKRCRSLQIHCFGAS